MAIITIDNKNMGDLPKPVETLTHEFTHASEVSESKASSIEELVQFYDKIGLL